MSCVTLRHGLVGLNHEHLEIILPDILSGLYEGLLHELLVHISAKKKCMLVLEDV